MSLRVCELELLASEWNRELVGGVVQKVYAPTPSRLYFELRVPGRSALVHLCADASVARLSVTETRPPNPPEPPTWQHVLRRDLLGCKLRDAEVLPTRRTMLLHFERDGVPWTLVFELGPPAAIHFITRDARVVATSMPARPGIRLGGTWTPLDEQPLKTQPSRLLGDVVFCRLSHAAEALFGQLERAAWDKARRAPLEGKLKRLERTREKVKADAARTEHAQTYRREGELLAQNLWQLKRGEREVTLTAYLEDGSTEAVKVPLDPKRSPKEEVDWRFHQYRRLLRGAQLAKTRLLALDAEEAQLRAKLAELEVLTEESAPPSRPPPKAADGQAPSLPYREYLGHQGQRIWVGRGSAHNDALTFHVARPFHVWFHVRGLPGAHVVVPVEKNSQLSGEALLDAATLALYHSDAKHEPRAEVSYVPVKFVRKGRDAAPGAVTYTREKTILLRVEPERLKRLLASEQT